MLVRKRRFDNTLEIVCDRLQRIGLARDHKLDPALRHASAKTLTRAAGEERADAVERMPVTAKFVK